MFSKASSTMILKNDWSIYVVVLFLGLSLGILSVLIPDKLIFLMVVLSLVLLFVFSPYEGLLLYLLIFPLFDQFTRFELLSLRGVIINPQILLRGILLTAIAFYWIRSQRRFFDYPLAKFIFFLLLYFLLDSVLSLDPVLSLTYWARMAFWLLLIPTVADIMFEVTKESPSRAVLLKRFVCFSLVIILVSVWFSRLTGILPQREAYGVGESFGQFFSQHSLALPLAMGFPWIIMLLFSQTGMVYPALLSGAMLITILGTYVRTAIVAIFVGISVALFFAIKHKFIDTAEKKIALVLVVLLMAGVVVGHFYSNKEAWLRRWQDFKSFEDAGAGRPVIYRADMNYFFESGIVRKVLGNGLGSSMLINRDRLDLGVVAHDDFVEILLDGGIVGLFLYLIFLFLMWSEIRKSLAARSLLGFAAGVGFAIFLTIGLVNGIVFSTAPLTYFAVLLGAMLSERKLREHLGVT